MKSHYISRTEVMQILYSNLHRGINGESAKKIFADMFESIEKLESVEVEGE
jgi:DUF438 domain-containing protein